jgi:hypothetical protein
MEYRLYELVEGKSFTADLPLVESFETEGRAVAAFRAREAGHGHDILDDTKPFHYRLVSISPDGVELDYDPKSGEWYVL